MNQIRQAIDIYPISLTGGEARELLRNSELRALVDKFARDLLEKNPTPLEAQAVLVRTWDAVLRNAKLMLIRLDHQRDEDPV